jgi:hypothetical protein
VVFVLGDRQLVTVRELTAHLFPENSSLELRAVFCATCRAARVLSLPLPGGSARIVIWGIYVLVTVDGGTADSGPARPVRKVYVRREELVSARAWSRKTSTFARIGFIDLHALCLTTRFRNLFLQQLSYFVLTGRKAAASWSPE